MPLILGLVGPLARSRFKVDPVIVHTPILLLLPILLIIGEVGGAAPPLREVIMSRALQGQLGWVGVGHGPPHLLIIAGTTSLPLLPSLLEDSLLIFHGSSRLPILEKIIHRLGDAHQGDRRQGEKMMDGDITFTHCHLGDHRQGDHHQGDYHLGECHQGECCLGDHRQGDHHQGDMSFLPGLMRSFMRGTG